MAQPNYFMNQRRLRANEHIRDLVAQVHVSYKDFIQPVFVDQTIQERKPVAYLTGVYSETIESLLKQTELDIKSGVSKFLLFPIVASKVNTAFNFDFVLQAVSALKKEFGTAIWLANDVCLCSYTAHGHCGILNTEGTQLLNNETVQLLADYALALAQAGSNCIAPSDMTDGRIAAIRNKLNQNDLDAVAIMSYSTKFSSSFYGPFRDACKSTPAAEIKLTGRNSYQIDARNLNDAMASSLRDIQEGADIIMVKPCTPYLDIVYNLATNTHTPIAVYHVSGEYAALELLAENKLAKREDLHRESWVSAKRAGASIIISYAARNAKLWLAD